MQPHLRKVLGAFGLSDEPCRLVSNKGKKAVWQVGRGGEFFLKRMAQSRERLGFVAGAVAHLREKGIQLPAFLPAMDGLPFAEQEGRLYVLMPAFVGCPPDYQEDLPLLMHSLGQFHAAGRGFQPPPGVKVHSLLGSWPATFGKKRAELIAFGAEARYRPSPFTRLFLAYGEEALRQIRAAERLLGRVRYARWVRRIHGEGCICHQDYAASNLLVDRGQICVLDLDSLVLDLPARDLRKVLQKVMGKEWVDARQVASMLAAYQEAYPLTPAECKVVAGDLQFPHLFCGLVNRYFTGRVAGKEEEVLSRKLHEVIGIERSKHEVVRLLAAR